MPHALAAPISPPNDTPRLRFVRARLADAARFLALEREIDTPRLYRPAATRAAAEAEIRRTCLYFLWLGRRQVGTIAWRRCSDGSIEISNLAVRPRYRGRGCARAAMLFVLRKHARAKRFMLVTHPENAAALRLYAARGFSVRASRENFFGDGEPRLVLTKES